MRRNRVLPFMGRKTRRTPVWVPVGTNNRFVGHNRVLVKSLVAAVAAQPRLTALLGAISISFSGVLYLYSDTSPETAAFFRCVFALPLLFFAAYLERRTARLNRQELRAYQASRRGGEMICRMVGDRVELQASAVFYLEGEIEF